MEQPNYEAIIEAILFAAGREVKITEIMNILEIGSDQISNIIGKIQNDLKNDNRGIELIRADDGFELRTKKELYDYIYPVIDNRARPTISNAALETLSIIAYNPKITRAEIEAIRGVSSDGTIYKLLDYNLIEDAGKSDAPGKPTTYRTTNEFLKMFGISSLSELPELPKYKLDENEQIVLEEFDNNNENSEEILDEDNAEIASEKNIEKVENNNSVEKEMEAPLPEGD